MPLPTVRGNQSRLAKKPARFIQVCKPLRYKPIEAIPCCALSNPIINSNYDSKLLNQRVAVKRKSKCPLMKGKAIQTNDIILENKTTQFPDISRIVKEEEYVEYKVIRPSGSTETVHKKTTSDIKYDNLNLVHGIKLEQSVSKQIVKSGSMDIMSLNTNYSDETTDGRVYKKIETQSKSVHKGKETRQGHIELVSSSKPRTPSTSQRSSRLSTHRRSSEKPAIGMKSGLSFRSRVSAIEGSTHSAEKSPRSGGGKVDSFCNESHRKWKDIKSARLPGHSIRHCPIHHKRKQANSEVVDGLKKNLKSQPIQQSGLSQNISVNYNTGILITDQQSEGSECQSNDHLRNEQKQEMLRQITASATAIQNQNICCDYLVAGQLVQGVANKSNSITEEMMDPKTRGPSTNAPNTDSMDSKSRKPSENASPRGQSQVACCRETRRTSVKSSARGQSQVSSTGEEKRNSEKSSPRGQTQDSPNGEERRISEKSSPRGQSQAFSTGEEKRISEKSSPIGQSPVSSTGEERRISGKSSPRGQTQDSPNGEERRISEKSSARGQSQASSTGEEKRISEKSSPIGQSPVSSTGEEKRISEKSSPRGQTQDSPNGEERRISEKSSPIGQSQVSSTGEEKRISEKSSPIGQSQVSSTGEERRISGKSSPRGQTQDSPNGEERRISEKSSPRGQSQASFTGEEKRISEKSSPIGECQVSSTGEEKRISEKSSPRGQSQDSTSREERRNSEKSSPKRQSQVSASGEERRMSENSSARYQSQVSDKYEGTSNEAKRASTKSSKDPSNSNFNEEPKTDEEKAASPRHQSDFRFNDIAVEQKALLHQDVNNAGLQEFGLNQNNEDSGNNSGQAKIKTRVYKSTEEEKVDADGTRANSLYVDSLSEMELADNNNAELQTEESEEAEDVAQLNNCFRGPQWTNACGYCCSGYWRMCNMRGYNNRMNFPGVSNCNGQCCSYNCCRPRQR